MKEKWFLNFLSILTILILVTGCAQTGNSQTGNSENGESAFETSKSENADDSDRRGDGDGTIDLDLTKLSGTMVYGEVFQLLVEPQAYVGKTIKVRGTYRVDNTSRENTSYHFIMIQDAAACCQNGLEFMANEYPEDSAEIEIVGTYSTYEEEGNTYYFIDAR